MAQINADCPQTVDGPANKDAIIAAVEQMPWRSMYIARIGIIPTESLKYFVIIKCMHTTTHNVCMEIICTHTKLQMAHHHTANELLLHKFVNTGHLHANCEHRQQGYLSVTT